MGTLSYTATMSLDGYIADANGDFQWAVPSDEVFQFHVERIDDVSTEVLGRRTHELMEYWRVEPDDGSWGELEREFAARWRNLEQIVASSTLMPSDVEEGTRLVTALDLTELAEIVADASGEVEISGPTTAAEAIRTGRVVNFRFFVVPVLIGGGLRALPEGTRLDLELVAHRVFDNGTTYLHYGAR